MTSLSDVVISLVNRSTSTTPDVDFFNAVTNTVALPGLNVNGNIQGYGTSAAGLVNITPDASTFTMTYVGGTTSPTGTAVWSRNGNQVTILIPLISATSAAGAPGTSFSFTGIPAALQTQRQFNGKLPFAEDNGSPTDGAWQINASSNTITFFKGASQSGTSWTSGGIKAITNNFGVTYFLN